MMAIYAEKTNQMAGKMKQLAVPAFLLLLTGCAFNMEDWEPKGEKLTYAVEQCRTEILQRDPLLGPLWHFSKDFKPCMEGTGHSKK